MANLKDVLGKIEIPSDGTFIVPPTVTEIEVNAFQGCSKLKAIEIPNSVKVIEENAFNGCISLTSIEIPDSVTEIKEGAFYKCNSLMSIYIPDSVTNIEAGAFGGCHDLTLIKVSVNNPKYKSDGNCCLLKDGSKLIFGCKESTIPDGVTEIGESAFEDCRELMSVKIPASVKVIGIYAFAECPSLTSLEILGGVEKIEDYAFYMCSLNAITLPDSVKEIGENAFDSCQEESVVIPNGVKRIGGNAFCRNQALKSIKIPESVEEIREMAFSSCNALETIAISKNNRYYTSANKCCLSYDGKRLIFGCNKSTIPDGVTEICGGAFYGCDKIESIEFPESVTEIGEEAFYGCSGLTSVEIPANVTKIGEMAFSRCDALDMITVSKGNTNYKSVNNCCLFNDGKRLLFGCNNSTIPDGVTEICRYAFYDCDKIESIEFPESVTVIGQNAFGSHLGWPTSVKSVVVNTRKKSPDQAENVSTIMGIFDPSIITLKVPIGCGYAYRHHPDFEGKFKEIQAVLD